MEEKKTFLEKEFGAHTLLLKANAYIISSTQVRAELKQEGRSLALSPQVDEYIRQQGLYRVFFDEHRKCVLDFISRNLSKKRFLHTLSVEKEVENLCRLFSVKDPESLRLAALLHDATKEWTLEEQTEFLSARGLLSEEDRISSAVLHGISASILAAEKGFLKKDRVLPIRYHTTGKKDMTVEEKILFFADYIEETRQYEACLKMRSRFYEALPQNESERMAHLDGCVLKVMEDTIAYLKEKNLPIHPLTMEGAKDLKERKYHDGH